MGEDNLTSSVEIMPLKQIGKFTKKLEVFFNFKLPTIPINIVESVEKFERMVGHKAQSWEVARTKRDGIIIMTEELIKKRSKSTFEKVLKHELVHMFFNHKNKGYEPVWLNEGLACVLSGMQFEKIEVDDTMKERMHTKEGFAKEPYNYRKAYWLVKNDFKAIKNKAQKNKTIL